MPAPPALATHLSDDGTIIVVGAGTTVTFRRPRFDAILIELTGIETPQISKLFFELLDRELAYDQRQHPRAGASTGIELFVDAHRVTEHGLMFEAWIRFLIDRKDRINRIHILAVNQVTQLSVEIIGHLSGIAARIKLYDDPSQFSNRMSSLARTVHPVEAVATAARFSLHLEALTPRNVPQCSDHPLRRPRTKGRQGH